MTMGHQRLRPAYFFAHGTIDRGVARKAHIAAEIGIAFFAIATLPADDSRIDSHLPAPEISRFNHTGELVSQNQRLRQPCISNARPIIPVPIRFAKPDSRYPNQVDPLTINRVFKILNLGAYFSSVWCICSINNCAAVFSDVKEKL